MLSLPRTVAQRAQPASRSSLRPTKAQALRARTWSGAPSRAQAPSTATTSSRLLGLPRGSPPAGWGGDCDYGSQYSQGYDSPDPHAAEVPASFDSDAEEDSTASDQTERGIETTVHPLLLCPRAMLRHVDTHDLAQIAEALAAESRTLTLLAADHWKADRRSTEDLITLYPTALSKWKVIPGAMSKDGRVELERYMPDGSRAVICGPTNLYEW